MNVVKSCALNFSYRGTMRGKLFLKPWTVRLIVKSVLLAISMIVTISATHSEQPADIGFAAQIHCSKERRTCAAVLRYAEVAGSKVGIMVAKDELGSVEVLSQENSPYPITINFAELGHGSIQLTWDGDYNPRQLSSSGLNCLDLSAVSKILIPVALDNTAIAADTEDGGLTKLEASLSLYDGNDPTGQRYSVGIAAIPNVESVLEFQRARFDRHGIRGPADFGCVGALSLVLSVENVKATALKVGIPSGEEVSFSSRAARETERSGLDVMPQFVGDSGAPRTIPQIVPDVTEKLNQQRVVDNRSTDDSDDVQIDERSNERTSLEEPWDDSESDMPVYGRAVAVY